nr:peptidoglycan-binding protein [Lachnoclostridium phytofermentans]
MRKLKCFCLAFIMFIVLNLVPFSSVVNDANIIVAEAHSGRTDSRGGHKDNKNKSGLGSYHFHCGGYSAHLHDNGVCPYKSSSKNQSSNKTSQNSNKKSNKTSNQPSSSKNNSSKTSTTIEKNIVKEVQLALNKLGYDCGDADGINGKKTKAAVKKFQEDNNLTVDGIIGKEVKKALNIK